MAETRSCSLERPVELPPFDRIRDGDYLPAFQAGMASSSRRWPASLTP